MHLKPNALGLAGGLVAAVCYLIDAVWYGLAPEAALNFYGYVTHNLDFTVLDGSGFTWGSFFAGLAVWFVFTYLAGYVFAWLYNKFAK